MDVGKGFGLEQARAVWSRRKWLFLVVFAACFTAALSFAMFLPNIYESRATVLVESPHVPENFVKTSVSGEIEGRLQRINHKILSRKRLGALIERMNLYPELRRPVVTGNGEEHMESIVSQMRKNITLELKSADMDRGRRETIAFALTYRGKDPQTVEEVTNTLASFFVAENAQVRRQEAGDTAAFLRTQLEEMKVSLDEQEKRLKGTNGDDKILGPLRMHAQLAALDRLNGQLRLTTERLDRARARKEALLRTLAAPGAGAALGMPLGEDPMLALQRKFTDLRARYTDRHPDVRRLKKEIAGLKKQLRSGSGREEPSAPIGGSTSAVRQSVSEVENEIQRLAAEEQRLQQVVAAQEKAVQDISLSSDEPLKALREYEAAKELYMSLLKRYADAQHARDLEQSDKGETFKIIDSAIPARDPVAPNRVLLSFVGLVLSLGLAGGFVLGTEQLDTSFHSQDELKHFTKVPVVTTIPNILTEADRAVRSRKLRLMWVGTAAALVLIVGGTYYVSHENEQFVQMVWRSRS